MALAVVAALVALTGSCAGKTPESESAADPAAAAKRAAAAAAAAPDTCPAFAKAPDILPGVKPEQRELGYWLERTGKATDLDEVLLDAGDIRRLNASYAVPREAFYPQHDLMTPVNPEVVARKAAGRIAFVRKKVDAGEYVGGDGKPAALPDWGPLPVAEVAPELRVALAPVELHCVPAETDLHVPSPTNHEVDPRIDHNACSTLHEQEPLQVLAHWPGDMMMVQSRYGFGWARADARLSPPVPAAQAAAFVHGPFASVTGGALELSAHADAGVATSVPEGARLPIVEAGRKHHRHHDGAALRLRYATADGFATAEATADRARAVARPFTRRAVLTEAFRFLGAPYGFGGAGAGIDCSRFLLDVFESFGIEVPRHSGWQSKAGSFSIDFTGVPEEDRLLLLDEAQKRGVVLLQLPGHIMLYLGRNDAGQPMAIHALGEYQKRCEQPDPVNSETTMQVNQLQVSTLGLGRGTSKTALIDRITRVTVFGKDPGTLLAGAAELRPGAPVELPAHGCHSRGVYIWATPRYTNAEEAMQILAMTNRDLGPVNVALVAPGGAVTHPPVVQLQGPPHGYLVRVAAPKRGTWKILLGDGDELRACRNVRVRPHLPRTIQKKAGKKFKPVEPMPREEVEAARAMAENMPDLAGMAAVKPPQMGAPVWQVRNEWSPYWESLYSMFVERLFDYPTDQDLTWNGLHLLLRDREHNLLYNYLGLGEDERIKLFPDCAELSYTLRSYFAWKMGLPYAYTRCTRAEPKHPPLCEPAGDNLMPRAMLGRDDADDIGSFIRFTTAEVGTSVSSSSGRTAPDDELGDYYPVRLTRRSLRPGTIFNDPYGHVLVVAGWQPQGAANYGVLIAADAQPDGTVGRRRFWRGSFLWKPDTRSGGAGFKAYRPALYDKTTHLISRSTNDELQKRHTRWTRFDDRVYQGTADDFYRRMEGLINPRPLDAETMMKSLVNALGEETARRVVSIDVGETYMKEHGFAVIDMPQGKGIFLASGPWEDFSTPSRDLRLLIAIDAVLGFPKEVRATPGRFAVAKADAASVAGEVDKKLQAELARRSFQYTRSDGSKQTLTLATLVSRQKALEMAYNPNDCPELRWGASDGSPELSTCGRHMPPEQRAEMERLRRWFATRERPAN